MHNSALDQFFTTLEELVQSLMRGFRHAAREIAAMSWPMLMLTCVGLAMLILIVPLALTLFIVFVIVKLAMWLLADRRQRGHVTPHTDIHRDSHRDTHRDIHDTKE